VLLLAKIRAAQEELGRRVDRRGMDASVGQTVVLDLEPFAAGLTVAWREGEQRPTYCRPYRRRKPLPRRASMLDDYQTQVRGSLDAEPALWLRSCSIA